MNHNGVSEVSELQAPVAVNLKSISLDFSETRRRDRHGNLFRYRSRIYFAGDSDLSKWCWDVFLLSAA